MKQSVKPIPSGYHALTPTLTLRNAKENIEWYKRAMGAKVRSLMTTPDKKGVLHAELEIGDSVFMVADEDPRMRTKSPKSLGGASGGVFVYTADVDALFASAIKAGAKEVAPPSDMFWGDRFAQFEDPSGHPWSLATHKEDVPPAEMEKRAQAWAAQMASRR